MFADDVKILRAVSNETDPMLLQEDLNKLSRWYEVKNVKKCHQFTY